MTRIPLSIYNILTGLGFFFLLQNNSRTQETETTTLYLHHLRSWRRRFLTRRRESPLWQVSQKARNRNLVHLMQGHRPRTSLHFLKRRVKMNGKKSTNPRQVVRTLLTMTPSKLTDHLQTPMCRVYSQAGLLTIWFTVNPRIVTWGKTNNTCCLLILTSRVDSQSQMALAFILDVLG